MTVRQDKPLKCGSRWTPLNSTEFPDLDIWRQLKIAGIVSREHRAVG